MSTQRGRSSAREGVGPSVGPSPLPSAPGPGPRPSAQPLRTGVGGTALPLEGGDLSDPRYDFHSHTFLTDGETAATDMWLQALALGHRALAITDHLYTEDPKPMLDRLLQEQKGFESEGLTTVVGVELSMVPPRRIAEAAKGARRAGAEIVIVHGETPVEAVPPGTNRAALSSNAVDLLAHPGLLTEEEAELARAHDVVLELSTRRGHSLGNGGVAKLALQIGADLVVDSDAHAPDQLVRQEFARKVAMGAGVPLAHVTKVLTETPLQLLKRLGKAGRS